MTWVKICGITNLEDARSAVEAGADAVGFVFYENSPRNVTPLAAAQIAAKLPEQVETIGVFVGQDRAKIEVVAEHVGVSGIQVHVDFRKESIPSRLGFLPDVKQYLALPAQYFCDQDSDFDGVARAARGISGIFLDSGTPEKPGGTGKIFDWPGAVPVAERIKGAGFQLIVAGGLNPTNVAEAMRILQPWGVDVSSGVEAAPGKKDPQKIHAFIAAVREAEKSIS
jgi:phosphoribosylanthranilate isomerase